MKVNPALEATWPMTGLVYRQDISDALDDLNAVKDVVENALALIGSQARDTAAEFLKAAKENVDRNRGKFLVDVGGGIAVLYSEVFPGNWCKADAENWTEYSFDSTTSHFADHNETTSFGGGGGLNLGFWSIGGSSQHTETRHELNKENDSLFISFEYSIAEINRPWLDTLLFRLNNWFIQGQKPGTVSNGSSEQLSKAIIEQDSLWLPAIPSQMILVKNLFISNSKFQEAYKSSRSYTSAGASFGWGPFSISGNYSRESTDVVIDTYQGRNGLRVKGVQLIGWVSEIIPLSPKINQPKS
jgi:hypothetical protein